MERRKGEAPENAGGGVRGKEKGGWRVRDEGGNERGKGTRRENERGGKGRGKRERDKQTQTDRERGRQKNKMQVNRTQEMKIH